MAQPRRIDSPKNDHVKELLRLKERRARERERRFLLEGEREILRAVESGLQVQELLVCPDYLRPGGEELSVRLAAQPGLQVFELSAPAFDRLSYRQGPDGLLAVAALPNADLSALQLPERALVLIASGLEKPGNLGALLRTADGAGLDAVFVTGVGTDLTNPNVIRASMGSLFSRPALPAGDTELLAWLAARGFTLVAATPHATQTYWEADYRGPTALLLGAEHQGLSRFWLDAASVRVSIPMQGLADSLNVATAGALLMYEALRQRQ
ncbi:MAG TPA: RNA methyltransferase [Trueperaceae bacterium]